MTKKWWKKPRQEAFKAYAIRDEILVGLGFNSYKQYLASEIWLSIRSRVLERDRGLCLSCGRKANQVHHTRYTRSVLSGESLDGARSICGRCHRISEFNLRGKVPLSEANKRLKQRSKRIRRNTAWECNPEYRRLWREKKRLLAMPRDEVHGRLAEVRSALRAIVTAQSVIARTPTYVTDDATLFVGKSTSRRLKMVSVPTGRHQPTPA